MSDYDFETPALAEAQKGMELNADVFIDVRDSQYTDRNGVHGVHPDSIKTGMPEASHRHVCIQWEGGVLWLDMSNQGDHFCIDARQFNPDGEMKGQGTFGIVNGQRVGFDRALPDTAGRLVKGFGWNGSYVVTLLTDRHGHDIAIRPSQGNG